MKNSHSERENSVPFFFHVEVNTKEQELQQRSRAPGPPEQHRDEGMGRCRAEC